MWRDLPSSASREEAQDLLGVETGWRRRLGPCLAAYVLSGLRLESRARHHCVQRGPRWAYSSRRRGPDARRDGQAQGGGAWRGVGAFSDRDEGGGGESVGEEEGGVTLQHRLKSGCCSVGVPITPPHSYTTTPPIGGCWGGGGGGGDICRAHYHRGGAFPSFSCTDSMLRALRSLIRSRLSLKS